MEGSWGRGGVGGRCGGQGFVRCLVGLYCGPWGSFCLLARLTKVRSLGHISKAHFTQGVMTNVQLKSSISIGAKVEISPKGFYFTLVVTSLK